MRRRDTYLQEAFNQVCDEAKTPEEWFVCLMEIDRVYLGPEEGGTWGDDVTVVAFQEFPSVELAERAKEKILELAHELSEQSRREHGRYCLETMEWLDRRGLDADYLPEPDGPTEYVVRVTNGIPTDHRACRHYE